MRWENEVGDHSERKEQIGKTPYGLCASLVSAISFIFAQCYGEDNTKVGLHLTASPT